MQYFLYLCEPRVAPEHDGVLYAPHFSASLRHVRPDSLRLAYVFPAARGVSRLHRVPWPPEALSLAFDELAQRLEIPGHRSAVAREILVARS